MKTIKEKKNLRSFLERVIRNNEDKIIAYKTIIINVIHSEKRVKSFA